MGRRRNGEMREKRGKEKMGERKTKPATQNEREKEKKK